MAQEPSEHYHRYRRELDNEVETQVTGGGIRAILIDADHQIEALQGWLDRRRKKGPAEYPLAEEQRAQNHVWLDRHLEQAQKRWAQQDEAVRAGIAYWQTQPTPHYSHPAQPLADLWTLIEEEAHA